jgi:hypothetical protein
MQDEISAMLNKDVKDEGVKPEPMDIDETALSVGPISNSATAGTKRKPDSPDSGSKKVRKTESKGDLKGKRRRADSNESSSSRKSMSPNPAVDGKVSL